MSARGGGAGRFNPSLFNRVAFGAGASAPRFGGLSASSRAGASGGEGGGDSSLGQGLPSLPEKEATGWSAAEVAGSGAGAGPASFERLRQVPES